MNWISSRVSAYFKQPIEHWSTGRHNSKFPIWGILPGERIFQEKEEPPDDILAIYNLIKDNFEQVITDTTQIVKEYTQKQTHCMNTSFVICSWLYLYLSKEPDIDISNFSFLEFIITDFIEKYNPQIQSITSNGINMIKLINMNSNAINQCHFLLVYKINNFCVIFDSWVNVRKGKPRIMTTDNLNELLLLFNTPSSIDNKWLFPELFFGPVINANDYRAYTIYTQSDLDTTYEKITQILKNTTAEKNERKRLAKEEETKRLAKEEETKRLAEIEILRVAKEAQNNVSPSVKPVKPSVKLVKPSVKSEEPSVKPSSSKRKRLPSLSKSSKRTKGGKKNKRRNKRRKTIKG